RGKMKIPANVAISLSLDPSQIFDKFLNLLSTWPIPSSSIDFDEAKNRYFICILTPFDVTNKILGPYMFGPNA
ncbi:hypothetical protein K503DRAFT_684704, partial [Rhizopogon vinicolor AM-OR11-026]